MENPKTLVWLRTPQGWPLDEPQEGSGMSLRHGQTGSPETWSRTYLSIPAALLGESCVQWARVFFLAIRCPLIWPECCLALELLGLGRWPPLCSTACVSPLFTGCITVTLDLVPHTERDHRVDGEKQCRVICSHCHITLASPLESAFS